MMPDRVWRRLRPGQWISVPNLTLLAQRWQSELNAIRAGQVVDLWISGRLAPVVVVVWSESRHRVFAVHVETLEAVLAQGPPSYGAACAALESRDGYVCTSALARALRSDGLTLCDARSEVVPL